MAYSMLELKYTVPSLHSAGVPSITADVVNLHFVLFLFLSSSLFYYTSISVITPAQLPAIRSECDEHTVVRTDVCNTISRDHD